MKGYFSPESELHYESPTIRLDYQNQKFKLEWVNQYNYKRNKISYIPSERSMVILPEIEKVEFPNNYLKSFLFDWFDARKNYSQESKLSMLDIDINFYFSENNKENHISNSSNVYDIVLSQASSGLQSLTPMMVMIDHLTQNIYSDEQNLSYELDELKVAVTQKLLMEFLIKPLYTEEEVKNLGRVDIVSKINQKILQNDETVMEHFNRFKEIRDNLFKTHSTNLIIEEPEQNLFPSTQKSLIYYMFNCINKSHNHSLTLTTHSPYVLYAINNCIMASLTEGKMREREKEKMSCLYSRISPTNISVYEIEEGRISCIQQEDGLIGENYFDKKMKEVMDEFYVMLNHI